jgi:hypothetical protein
MTDFAKANALDPSAGYSLHDLANGEVPCGLESVEYEGLFLHGEDASQEWTEGDIRVRAEGHAGIITWLSSDDYDDVLELVAELNSLLLEWQNHIEHGSLDELVEFAGPRVTDDPEKAADSEFYVHVPTDRGQGAEA